MNIFSIFDSATVSLPSASELYDSIDGERITRLFWDTVDQIPPIETIASYILENIVPIILITAAIALPLAGFYYYYTTADQADPASESPAAPAPSPAAPSQPTRTPAASDASSTSTVNSNQSTSIARSPSASPESAIIPYHPSPFRFSPAVGAASPRVLLPNRRVTVIQQPIHNEPSVATKIDPKPFKLRIARPDLPLPICIPSRPAPRLCIDWLSNAFREYMTTYNPTVSADDAWKMANKGDEILDSIKRGEAAPIPEDALYAEYLLASITWAFMRRAVEKKQTFNEGTFVIEDPNGSLYAYLNQLKPYRRLSSHFDKRSLPLKLFSSLLPKFASLQLGKDITTYPLPSGHRTILFAQIDAGTERQALFFKPEKAGADFTTLDFWIHMADYFVSLTRRGKAGANEQAGMRKERIPHEAKELFSRFLDSYCSDQGLLDSFAAPRQATPNVNLRDSKEQHMAQFNAYGIQYIHWFREARDAQKANFDHTDEFEQALNAIIDYLGNFDSPDKRTGNEVLLTL